MRWQFPIIIQHRHVVTLDQKSADLIAKEVGRIVAAQTAALLQEALKSMSEMNDKLAALAAATTDLTASVNTVAAGVADLKASGGDSADSLAAVDTATAAVSSAASTLRGLFPAADTTTSGAGNDTLTSSDGGDTITSEVDPNAIV